MLKDGKINAYWIQVNNNLQTAANMNFTNRSGVSATCPDCHRARQRRTRPSW